jgi:hypothetical protein
MVVFWPRLPSRDSSSPIPKNVPVNESPAPTGDRHLTGMETGLHQAIEGTGRPSIDLTLALVAAKVMRPPAPADTVGTRGRRDCEPARGQPIDEVTRMLEWWPTAWLARSTRRGGWL